MTLSQMNWQLSTGATFSFDFLLSFAKMSTIGYQCMHCGNIFPDQITLTTHDCESEEDNKWGRPMVLALLNIYPQENEKFLKGLYKKKKKVYDMTAQKLQELGYSNIDGQACDQKWRNLKKRYMTHKKRKNQTGTGRMRFEYFAEMDEILGEKPNVSPLSTYDSESSQPTYRDDITVSPIVPDIPAAASSSSAPEKICNIKKRSGPSWYSDWDKKHEKAEEAKRKRHEENLEVKKRALAALEKLVEAKLSKKTDKSQE